MSRVDTRGVPKPKLVLTYYVPADIVDKHAPLLTKHRELLKSHPKIAAYYAARGK